MRILIAISVTFLCGIVFWLEPVIVQKDENNKIYTDSDQQGSEIDDTLPHVYAQSKHGFVLHGVFIDQHMRVAYISVGNQPQQPLTINQYIDRQYKVQAIFPRHVAIGNDSEFFVIHLKQYIDNGETTVNTEDMRGIPALPAHASVAMARPIEGIKRIQRNQYSIDRDKIYEEVNSTDVFREANFLIEDDGVFIERIEEGSILESIGLRVGDTILKANDMPVASLFDLLDLYEKLDELDFLELQINRTNQAQYLHYEIR